MSGIVVGSVEVEVLPTSRTFGKLLKAQLTPEADKLGADIGEKIGLQITARIQKAIRDGMKSDPATPKTEGDKSGQRYADAFSKIVKSKLEATLRSLPDVKVNADTSPADRKIADIRAELLTLSGKRLGIDIADDAALAKIDELKAKLEQVRAEDPRVRVQVNTAEAIAQLEALRAEIDHVKSEEGSAGDGSSKTIVPHVDPGPALAAIGAIKLALLGLGAIGVITPLVGGLAAMAGPLAGAAAGFGGLAAVAAPALKNITGALTAQKSAQDAVTKAAGRSGAAQVNVAQQVASAEANLKQARDAAANSAITNSEAIARAQQSVGDAVRSAASQQISAAQAVASAEMSLKSAQDSARQAQKDLTQARIDATRALQDQNNSLADAQLGLRDAQLSVQEQQDALAQTLANPQATEDQKQRAQLAGDEAVQHLKEQQVEVQRLQSDTAAANKAGVDGSKQVVAAQQQVVQTQQQLEQSSQALGNARRAQADQEIASAEAIKNAQQGLADAERNAAFQAETSAHAIAAATAQLQQAKASGSGGGGGAVASTAAAAAAALAKLTPAEREAMAAFEDLKTSFMGWQKSLEPAVLGALTGSFGVLKDLLPLLTPIIQAVSGALAELWPNVEKALGSPFWQTFSQTLAKLAGSAVTGTATVLGNLAHAFADLVTGLAPLSGAVGGGLIALTSQLAQAGDGGGIAKFASTLSSIAPIIQGAFSALGPLLGQILQLGAQLAGPVLGLIGSLAGTLTSLFRTAGPSLAAFVAVLGSALAPVLAAVGKALGPVVIVLAHALMPIVQALSPILAQLAGLLGTLLVGAIQYLAPVLAGWIGLIGDVLNAIAPLIPVVEQLAEQLGTAYGQALQAVAPLVAQLVAAIAPLLPMLISALLPVILDLLPPLLQLIQAILPPLIGLIKLIVPPLADVVTWIGKVLGIAATFSATIIGYVAGFITWLTKTLPDAVSSATKWLQDRFTDVETFFEGMPDKIAAIGSTMWDGIKDGFKAAINTIIGIWDNFHLSAHIHVPHIPGTDIGGDYGFDVTLPHIPYLANGGTLDSAGSVVVGERGPELLTLPQGAQVTPLTHHSSRDGAGAHGAGVTMNNTWNVAETVDGDVIAKRLSWELARSSFSGLGLAR